MSDSSGLQPIPQPKPAPILKNLPNLDVDRMIESLMVLAKQYGPLYRVSFPAQDILIVSSQEFVNEICDETRFDKKLHAALKKIRDFAGDGLFTANTREPNWERAHRILVPALGAASIREMFDPMLDLAEQMLTRWERFGPNAVIDVADNMTRLTLDTIAICAFGYRFNSFYQVEMHPFVGAMIDALEEAGAHTRRLPLKNRFLFKSKRRYAENIQFMRKVADELIAERRKNPESAGKKDLLALMMSGRDPVTGEGLSDQNIQYQMLTFLIAGHETTSGLLSFALYALLRNPPALRKAQEQVDEVLGTDTPRFEHLARLTYVDQVLKETLRLWPTAPGFSVQAKEDAVLGGRYKIKQRETLLILLPMLHRDPKVWSGDVEAFEPDRFRPEAYAALPENAWKPFGNGQRACIGRPFAMQEAILVLAMILQRFDLSEADPAYQLDIKETLTWKPEGFAIRARRRNVARTTRVAPAAESAPEPIVAVAEGAPPLLVLYGSNSGSSEAFAKRIASDAARRGFASKTAPMDEYAAKLPTEGALVVVTASYEGIPPDNAKRFVAWLNTAPPDSLAGVRFAVFGCGNRDWARTYQAVPKSVDERLADRGAQRLHPRGEADARGDFFGAFDQWCEGFLPVLENAFGRGAETAPLRAGGALYSVEVVADARAARLQRAGLALGEVVANRELVDLTSPLARSKHHVEIALPAGMEYRAGDYLVVLPVNPRSTVERALRRFGFDDQTQVVIRRAADAESALPIGVPVRAADVLAHYVELAQPATRRQVETLAQATECPPERKELSALAEESRHRAEILEKRVSVLDLLERYASCTLPFAGFLELLPNLRTRQYSISSSPLANPRHCTLTFSVVGGPAWSGQGQFRGVASNHLAEAPIGARIAVATRPSPPDFHLPDDPTVPVIMVGAGSGLAPFRGFIEERAMQRAQGIGLGEGLFFFGCVHPEVDFLYRDELHAWEAARAVRVLPAFSRAGDGPVKYVQDRLWQERADVMRLFDAGAHFYVCGDGKRMALAVRETVLRIYEEARSATPEEAERWVADLETKARRYATDVFS